MSPNGRVTAAITLTTAIFSPTSRSIALFEYYQTLMLSCQAKTASDIVDLRCLETIRGLRCPFRRHLASSFRFETLACKENMRPIEMSIVLLCFVAVVATFLLRRPWPFWVRTVVIASGLLVLVHAWVEGIHWQMFPVYLAVVVLLPGLSKRAAGKRGPAVLAGCATVLLACGVAFSLVLPMFHLPKTTGPYPVGTRTLDFIDPNRRETHADTKPGNREVVIQMWYPSATSHWKHAMYRKWKETDLRSTYQAVLPTDSLQDAPFARGRFPVILFNPSWHGFRNRSTYLTQELASQGFVVVGVAHPYNSAWTELHDGSVADLGNRDDLGHFWVPKTLEQRRAIASTELAIQTGDNRFVLDELTKLDQAPNSPYSGHLDLTRVGACGHSFGGAVSVELAATDPRVIAALELDGAIYGEVEQHGLSKPLMRINSPETTLPPDSEHSPSLAVRVWARMRELNDQAVARTYSQFGGYEVNIDGITHENFDDKGFFSPIRGLTHIGSMSQLESAKIVDAYAVAFFRQTLLNEPQPLLSGTIKPPPESHLVIWPGQAAANSKAESFPLRQHP
jgi:pimeloyl-ACP methyl ester carboxylesterase